MKCSTAFFACLFLLTAAMRADSIDDAEAARRGVPVQQVQLEKAREEIARLQKEVSDLEGQLALAKKQLQSLESGRKPGEASTAPALAGMPTIEESLAWAKAQLAERKERLGRMARGRVAPASERKGPIWTIDKDGNYVFYENSMRGYGPQDIRASMMARQQKVVDEMAARVRDIEAGKNIPPDLVEDKLVAGAVGRMRCSDEVHPDDKYLISCTVSQVVDDRTMLVERGEATHYWVHGLPTSGLVDGARINLSGVFRVGTKTYATALGSQKTVFSLEFLGLPPQ